MKIVHTIGINVSPYEMKKLKEYGIDSEIGLKIFKVDEESPLWEKFNLYFDNKIPEHSIETLFSKSELSNSSYLVVEPQWHYLYPQPEENFAYLQQTYDLANFCNNCGIGKVQNDSFYFKKHPQLRAKKIFQLNWIFDEYFVDKNIYKNIFEPFNISYIPVKTIKDNKIINEAVQLNIPIANDTFIESSSLEFKRCDKCGKIKFRPISKGYFPRINVNQNKHIFKTFEWFGDSSLAYQKIFISNDLFTKLKEENLKGISFRPCLP
jgi:hypothetical protein